MWLITHRLILSIIILRYLSLSLLIYLHSNKWWVTVKAKWSPRNICEEVCRWKTNCYSPVFLPLFSRRLGGRDVREFNINMYTLLYLKWIINKDLLYSTGNSAQCYVAAWMGGVWGRMDACICMAEWLCCAPETLTRLWIGYTPI